jgi:hypothetical protein
VMVAVNCAEGLISEFAKTLQTTTFSTDITILAAGCGTTGRGHTAKVGSGTSGAVGESVTPAQPVNISTPTMDAATPLPTCFILPFCDIDIGRLLRLARTV